MKRPFMIACNKVVLANGGSDLVNRLGVKGESKSLPWLKYELPLLESAIDDIKDDERSKVKPVLIVGAGLSAADAILACRNAGLHVIHVFRGVAAGFVSISIPSILLFLISCAVTNVIVNILKARKTEECEIWSAK
jgi:uncharacterized NAD(P)/FAD-binding protein YdhS